MPETQQHAVRINRNRDLAEERITTFDERRVWLQNTGLCEIIEAATSDLPVRLMVQRIRDIIARTLECSECRVLLISEAGEAVIVSGIATGELKRRYSIDRFPVLRQAVAGAGQPIYQVMDPNLPADVRELMVREQIQVMSLVPIESGSSTVGIAMLIDPVAGHFSSSDLEFARIAFQPLGLAIERFRSDKILRLHSERHDMLRKVGEATMANLERQPMARALTEAFVSFEGIHACAFAVLNSASAELDILSVSSHDRCWLEEHSCMKVADWPAVSAAFERACPLLLEDDYRYDQVHHSRIIRDHGYVRSLLVPIVDDGRIVGLVALYSRCFQAFSHAGIDIYAELGDRVLFGLQRCQLHETERAQRELSDQLIQVIGRINAVSPDEKRILPVLAEVVREVARADAVEIVTYPGQDDESELVCSVTDDSGKTPSVSEGSRLVSPDNPTEREMIATGRTVLNSEGDGCKTEFGQAAVVPLMAWHDVTGAIWIWNKHDEFSEERMHMIEAIGQHAGMAIERARLFAEVRWQAERDGLTGMYNHHSILTRLEHELSTSRRDGDLLAVLLFDLDNFKQLNDSFGHLAGDRVLKDISVILKEWASEHDICGRYGGDEFLVIMPGATSDDAQLMAEQLTHRISQIDMRRTDEPVLIEISTGIATFPENGSTWQSLINHADRAMYEAKDTDGSQVRTSGAGRIIPLSSPPPEFFNDW